MKPCDDQYGGNGDHSIDTSKLGDGHHVIAPEAWDAAGRRKQGGGQTSTSTTTPRTRLPGCRSTAAKAGRTRTAARSAGRTRTAAAPIAGAQVQVCKTGTSDCRTATTTAVDQRRRRHRRLRRPRRLHRPRVSQGRGGEPQCLEPLQRRPAAVRQPGAGPGGRGQANGWLNAEERARTSSASGGRGGVQAGVWYQGLLAHHERHRS